MVLDPGDPAPDVSAPTQDGAVVSPDFSSPTVVAFYPEDGSPGCTTELEQFAREREAYEEAGVTVYGVSVDGVDSHREFAAETGVDFDLLADPDGALADAFGVERTAPGDRTPRTTVVLADGRVRRVYTGVAPDGHARDLLLDLLDDGLVALE
jgi:peroxiredoxin Q/BCP